MIDPAKIAPPLPSEEELNSKPVFERENLRTYAGSADLTREQIGIARGSYYGMVSLVDAQVGRIVQYLKKQGLIDNTIIAVNSDLDVPKDIAGRSLLPLIDGQAGQGREVCFCEHDYSSPNT